MTTSGHRVPPFARRMKLPMEPMGSLVRVAQDGLEGVLARSFFGQFVCPFVASSHEAASITSLACSALDTCAMLFVTESMWAFRHGVDVGISSRSRCGLRPQCLGSSPRFASTRQRAAFVSLCTISAHAPSLSALSHNQIRTSLLAPTR